MRKISSGNVDGRGPGQRASVFLYGGTIMPGLLEGRALDITSVFEAVGENAVGAISDEELKAIECAACPGEGSCAGMFTANTMASVGEALGMSLLGSASVPSIDPRRDQLAYDSGTAVLNLSDRGINARHIMTKAAFENAIAVVMASAAVDQRRTSPAGHCSRGSRRPRARRLQQIAQRVPHIADTKPHGKYHMSDLDTIGGVPVVLAHLLETGRLEGDVMTVSGKTMAENLADFHAEAARRGRHPQRRSSHSRPRRHRGTARSLAPKGAVVKVAGMDDLYFRGTARVFDGEFSAMDAIMANEIAPQTVVVIRYEGPKGGPGMREMLAITGAMKGVGRGADCALVTDGRFSGGTHGFCVGHAAPEALDGGPIALVRDGDEIMIDVNTLSIDLMVDEAELAERAKHVPPSRRATPPESWRSSLAWPKGPKGRGHDSLVVVSALRLRYETRDQSLRGALASAGGASFAAARLMK